jgi:choline dehydrogenase-like flavoprotein
MKEHYDVIIVGTGFASSFFLLRLIERYGTSKKILVLERGVHYAHKDRVQNMREKKASDIVNWEKSAVKIENENPEKPWLFDPNFGGTSNAWTGCTPRFMPNDFSLKSTYGVGVDWPLSYHELENYYSETEEIMAICGPEETPFPKTRPYPLKSHPLSAFDKLIQNQYGNLYISQPCARPTQSVGIRPKCCSAVVCNLCPINSKFTIENSLSYLYQSENVQIEYDAVAYSLIIENKVAKGVAYSQKGATKEVFGEVVVLGANAIFNAHILLNSGDTRYYTGKGLTEQAGTYAFFYLDNVNNIGGGSVIPANGYMMYDVPTRSEYSGCLIESHNTRFIRGENGKWRHIAKLKFIFENIPSDTDKIELSEDILMPRVVYGGHSAYASTALKKLESNVSNYFSRLPIEKIYFDGFFQKSEYHICSTTRMSKDPAEGVVDENQVHHDYRNVLVLGSGVFPTISPSNPTLTLSALSLRAFDKFFLL